MSNIFDIKGYTDQNSFAAGMNNFNSNGNTRQAYKSPVGISDKIVAERIAGTGPQGSYVDNVKDMGFGTYAGALFKDGMNFGSEKIDSLGKSGLDAWGSVLGGFGDLAKGWAAIKGLGLTEDAMKTQSDQWNKNYGNQVTTINNQIDNQNAWKKAQGRTDFGQRVGTQQY